MNQTSLTAAPRTREAKGSNRRLRNAGRVPAVVYGGTAEPRSISVDHHELDLILRGASRSTAVFNLELDGAAEQTILRDLQRHPVNNRVVHADFQRIDLESEIEVEIPIHVTGQIPLGVRNGGILEHVMRSLRVSCRPLNIPKSLDADLSNLGFNQSFHVSDLQLPEGVTVIEEPDTALFVIAAPKGEDTTTPTTEAAEPEVIGAKKKDEEKDDDKKK